MRVSIAAVLKPLCCVAPGVRQSRSSACAENRNVQRKTDSIFKVIRRNSRELGVFIYLRLGSDNI